MTLIVCICDYWQRRHYYNRQSIQAAGGTDADKSQKKSVRRLQLQLDAITGNYWLRELLQQRALRERLQTEHNVQLIWLSFHPPERDTIDYKWADMLAHTIWEHIEMEHLMSWLSTLGGGFSALGEQFERCAQTAGKISLQQLTIGLRVGDPFLQARCKLYYSISLIQRGQLRKAKQLIRAQYQFAKQHEEHDHRLVRMCLGIWLRLRYEYEERRKRRLAIKDQS
ncbi:uncharacterized protein F58A4.6 [Drosophila mojavensis]|uniref:Uncharacterized protein n=1 Tax=Drosophila mojavensis TaxID=7230 RepID=B4L4I1_DROMO|nr:uncharacterized protein F58A4.6 [Drosophila mojavensis]EDW07459.1 uncharacterized protein Dmoj_GI14859 [Drosophila mojavensis]